MTKYLKKILINICILIFLGNLVAYFIDHSFIDKPKIWLINSFFAVFVGYPMMLLNEIIIKLFAKKIKWERNPIRRILISVGIIIVIATFITLLLNYIFVVYLHHESYSNFIAATLNMLLIETLIIVYAFTLVTGIEFFKLWKEGLIKQESLQRKAIELQLDTLKNQVNPHFLFNSLNILTSLVYKDPDKAASFIHQLSDIYRYVLENKDKDMVEWETERAFVENYLNLQQMRFINTLKVRIDSIENNFLVIPLSVQMLLENAIKHNIITNEEPLSINIFVRDGYLVVQNNLQRKSIIEKSGNIGLENIKQRYEILSQRKVEVSDNDGYFTVKLPLIAIQEN
jgi:LytS/YehU family sensor histidine kinase